VEGLNVGGYLLGYLAVLVFAGTSLVALGLLIVGLTKPARIVFAAGLLTADGIAAVENHRPLMHLHQRAHLD
jgi:hypothetical protein